MGLAPLEEEEGKEISALKKVQVSTQLQSGHLHARKRAFTRFKSASILILDVLTFRTVINKYLLF